MQNFLRAAILAVVVVVGGQAATAMDMSSEIEAENAIRGAGPSAVQIRRLDAVPSVGVINLNFPGGPMLTRRRASEMDAGDFKGLAQGHADGVSRMRRALLANPVTRAALRDHGVSAEDIIGVRISSNGSLRLFVLR